MNRVEFAKLGALVGLYEAIAIVRWDWLMDDMRSWRLAVGVGHAFIILALNIGLFSLLGVALRKKLFLVCAAYAGLVYSTRILGEDRYESTSLWALGAIFTLWMLRTIWPWVTGLSPSPWRRPVVRVPVYTTPVDEQILFLVPVL